MKLPNGYGSVTKLSGNRRKPYLARVTLGWITDEQTGKTVQNRVPLGTFKTKKEALQALAEYGANPYDIQNAAMTLAELYDKWTAAYFPTLESESSCRTIKSAWSYCHAIAGMRVKDLRARHIKGIMEDGYIMPAGVHVSSCVVPLSSVNSPPSKIQRPDLPAAFVALPLVEVL